LKRSTFSRSKLEPKKKQNKRKINEKMKKNK